MDALCHGNVIVVKSTFIMDKYDFYEGTSLQKPRELNISKFSMLNHTQCKEFAILYRGFTINMAAVIIHYLS